MYRARYGIASALFMAMLAPAMANETSAVPMDQINMAGPEGGGPIAPAPQDASPFIKDAKFSAQLRSYYLYRDKFDDKLMEAWAIGGSVGVKSGYAGGFAIGAMAYTSQPLHAPEDRDGTGLLASGQDGYTVLGQIYGEYKFNEGLFAALGRKEYNTPFINKNDARMTPNTFEGGTMYGTHADGSGGKWNFGGGYLSKIKERTSEEFESMSRVSGVGADVDRGVYLAGANYQKGDLSLGAIDYYSDDIVNIFYTEGKYGIPLGNGYKLKLAAQYIDQGSTGENLSGKFGDFSTNQWGLKGELGVGSATFTIAYTKMDDEKDAMNPWGGYPGYTSVQVMDFNRAGEAATLLKASYDFSKMGAPGVSAYALWVDGSGVKTSSTVFNQDEANLNLQWTAQAGEWKGTSIRVRYAEIYQQGNGDPVTEDFRIIFNYDFK